jgi:glycosyltransferase involved in cell wall biosynthesis
MFSHEKVAIIIPVYNAERYLSRCIESVLNQKYPYINLILVNDGSSDTSGSICDDYAKRDGRVSVIHQRNSGVSRARNAGVEAADADYVMFVDADDEVTPCSITSLLNALRKTGADIATGAYEFVHLNAHSEIVSHNRSTIQTLIDNKGGFAHLLQSREMTACCRLYSSKITKQINFTSGIGINEDKLYIYKAFQKAKSSVYINDLVYRYHQNAHSATNTGFSEKYFAIEVVADKIHNIVIESYPELKIDADSHRLKSLMELFYLLSGSPDAQNKFAVQYRALRERIGSDSYLLRPRARLKWLIQRWMPKLYRTISRCRTAFKHTGTL